MRIQLNPHEARVIGSLIEKEVTTPDQYPLSLSALTTACNQKSSREPVMDLSEVEVQEAVDSLRKKHLVSDRSGFGSRVTKYQHRFCNTGFGGFEFSSQELGIICVLLLRGAQTPGELRTRTNRLCEFSDVQETEGVLQRLMDREDGPFVARLAREPGKRESRFVHLFGDSELQHTHSEHDQEEMTEVQQMSQQQRLEELEASVERLESSLRRLEARVEQLEQG